MRIGINLTFLSNNTHSCVSKYVDSLLEGFRSLELLSQCSLFIQEHCYEQIVLKFPEAKIILADFLSRKVNLFHSSPEISQFRKLSNLNRKIASSAVQRYQIDLMLFPYNDGSIHFVKGIPNIVVVQELYDSKTVSSDCYPSPSILRKQLQNLKQADAIIATSHAVKSELVRVLCDYNEKLIHVIPTPIKTATIFTGFTPIEEPYILADVSHSSTKNTMTLLKAFYLIHRRIPHQLILLKKNWKEDLALKEYMKDHELTDKVFCLSNLPSTHQNNLILHASLVINPSLSTYASQLSIEAAMLQIPVISTRTTTSFELTKGLLSYYDAAMDSRELAIRILQILRCPPQKEALEKIASTFAMLYDQTTVASHYKELLNHSSCQP